MNPDTQSPTAKTRERQEMSALLRLIGSLGISVCGGILLFFFAGVYLDRYLGWDGVCVILGLIAGIAFSLYYGYRTIMDHVTRFAPKRTDTQDNRQEEDHTDA